MKRSLLLFATLLACAMPLARSSAEVSFSVSIAPPVLQVEEQPLCPADGYLWTPGYWAWDDGAYYWVPGVWVAPPRAGLLWTPGYWGYSGGHYGFYDGYWGPTVGFYGGINYGYGYGGRGYYGGRWDGGSFRYNTAVTHVNTNVIHNVYQDRSFHNVTSGRTSFNGPGGVHVRPTAQERAAMTQAHVPPTGEQFSRRQMAARQRVASGAAKPETRAFAHANRGAKHLRQAAAMNTHGAQPTVNKVARVHTNHMAHQATRNVQHVQHVQHVQRVQRVQHMQAARPHAAAHAQPQRAGGKGKQKKN
jgi:hypothetical protein